MTLFLDLDPSSFDPRRSTRRLPLARSLDRTNHARAFALAATLLAGCGGSVATTSTLPTADEPAPASRRASFDAPMGTRFFGVSIFFTAGVRAEVDASIDATFARHPEFTRAPEPTFDPRHATAATLVVDADTAVLEDERYLELFAYGLDDSDVARVRASRSEMYVAFVIPREDDALRLRSAYLFVAELARSLDGFVWDSESRELFVEETFREKRVDAWDGAIPNAMLQIGVHGYRSGNGVRVVTLGMMRFGRPDVVIEDLDESLFDRGRALLVIAAQTLVEREPAEELRDLPIDLATLGSATARSTARAFLFSGAEARADLRVHPEPLDEGDSDNALLRIEIPPSAPDARLQAALFDRFFGLDDEIAYVGHDAALLEASRRAKARLFAMRSRLGGRIPPGVALQVEAPFQHDRGREWLWIRVESWRDGAFVGIVLSEPEHLQDVARGQRVTVPEDAIFDYLLDEGGRHEGGETQTIIERRSP